MKKDLMQEPNLVSVNKKIKFDYDLYMKAIKAIADDIQKRYDLEEEKIGIIGVARGGLPMLVSLSHALNHRDIDIIQVQVSKTDACHDFGEVKILKDTISDNVDKYIIFEDIILKGRSTAAVINTLKERGKEIVAVYTLIVDEGFLDIDIGSGNIPINYCYKINRDDWVYFMWETNLNENK